MARPSRRRVWIRVSLRWRVWFCGRPSHTGPQRRRCISLKRTYGDCLAAVYITPAAVQTAAHAPYAPWRAAEPGAAGPRDFDWPLGQAPRQALPAGAWSRVGVEHVGRAQIAQMRTFGSAGLDIRPCGHEHLSRFALGAKRARVHPRARAERLLTPPPLV